MMDVMTSEQSPTEVHQNLRSVQRHYTDPRRNRVMKLEDRWHQFRLNMARRRGQDVTVLSLTGYGSPRWVRVFSRVVMAPDTDFENGRRVAKVIADGVRGWRNFVSAPVPFARLNVVIAGRSYPVSADRGGIVDTMITLDDGAAPLPAGTQEITLEAPGAEPTQAEVHIIGDDVAHGVVCDIDDTVVVTKLPRPFLAAWNSFVLDEHARTPTPGMAVMMERLLAGFPAPQGTPPPVMYLSTGAWNVAQTLTRFLTRNLYPEGPLLLTDWGPTEDRWFRSGQRHKVEQLDRLAREFPHIKWTLIGDDGQHDPVIYADFVRKHPAQARAVIIRELTYSEAVLAGGRAEQPGGEERVTLSEDGEHRAGFQDIGEYRIPWIYGPDGKDISESLAELDLL